MTYIKNTGKCMNLVEVAVDRGSNSRSYRGNKLREESREGNSVFIRVSLCLEDNTEHDPLRTSLEILSEAVCKSSFDIRVTVLIVHRSSRPSHRKQGLWHQFRTGWIMAHY